MRRASIDLQKAIEEYGWHQWRTDSGTLVLERPECQVKVWFDGQQRVRYADFMTFGPTGGTDRILGGISAVIETLRLFGRK